MRIHQPMLFVGLGGTGCLIGAELERRFRDELCGPDGLALQETLKDSSLLPYQLPGCIQFVYADLNQEELDRARRAVSPTEDDLAAVDLTAHFVQNLVPRHHTYPEVARSLRVNNPREIDGWLPPAPGEPRVAPLARGAGQLPTVGRAALFETLRSGLAAAQGPIRDAISAIAKSNDHLAGLGGKSVDSCDVFVAFSVAGGTGAGIFMDFLHLVGDAFQNSNISIRIYPLVLMPSAFTDGSGGGQPAVLNAGRALLDLFRLVDDQNGQAAESDVQDHAAGTRDSGERVGGISVTYPNEREIRLNASTVQTAFLFTRTPGVRREDLHRSVVSLVTSLLGTGLEASRRTPGNAVYQSFADDFINRGVEREMISVSGIGYRGVSTALVASMTVPVDDLADIVSSRLLARAVDELSTPPPGRAEDNRPLIEYFFDSSGLGPLRQRAPLVFTEPPQAQGMSPILQTLRRRSDLLVNTLESLDLGLARTVPELARSFDYRKAVTALLGSADLFRAQRVVVGDQRLSDPMDRNGFVGQLEARRVQPRAPEGLDFLPPQPRPIQDLRGLARRIRWNHKLVELSLRDQNVWYRWRTHQIWNKHWAEQSRVWDREVNRLRSELTALTGALLDHARADDTRFNRRTQDLYRARTGVSYLLPPYGDLDIFYQNVVRRFVSLHQLRPVAREAEIVTTLLGTDGWRRAYELSYTRNPERAVAFLRRQLKKAVKDLFRQSSGFADDQPLLPELSQLLLRASGRDSVPVSDDDLAQFQAKIAGMLPGGFSPQGSGRLKVLVGYPGGKDDGAERYLNEQLQFTREQGMTLEFRALGSAGASPTVTPSGQPAFERDAGSESLVVVMFRTSMGVTEVPELRSVLHTWSSAVESEKSQDYLAWRQRLGYDFSWLVTTEEDRVRILHRLLNAMWNGRVRVLSGEDSSPGRIRVELGELQATAMALNLRTFGASSSWGSLIRAYEEWTLADDQQIRGDFCRQLMETVPDGLNASPGPPSPLFSLFVDEIRPEQVKRLRALAGDRGPGRARWSGHLLGFWEETVEAALRLPFTGSNLRLADNLVELRGLFEGG